MVGTSRRGEVGAWAVDVVVEEVRVDHEGKGSRGWVLLTGERESREIERIGERKERAMGGLALLSSGNTMGKIMRKLGLGIC